MSKWLFILVSLALMEAIVTGLLPLTKSALYAGLASHPSAVFFSLAIFAGNLIVLELVRAGKPYAILRTAMRTRYDRTKALFHDQHKDVLTTYPNAPQRIQEDVKQSFLLRYEAYTEFGISGAIVIYLILVNLTNPLVLATAAVYALVSILITLKFRPAIQRVEQEVQGQEADFRETLSESASGFYRKLSLGTSLGLTIEANLKAARLRLGFDLFSKLQTAGVIILPILIFLPLLVLGSINFEKFLDLTTTFEILVVNAAILCYVFPVLIKGNASEKRVADLEDTL